MREKIGYNGGPWPWCLDLTTGARCSSLYSLYYEAVEGSGLLVDTPAMDSRGRFLWCTSARRLKCIQENVTKKLYRLGMTSGMGNRISVATALRGLDEDEKNAKYRGETLGLINVVLDYIVFLVSDEEDRRAAQRLDVLSEYLFNGTRTSEYYEDERTTVKEVRRDLLYNIWRILDNSRIL